MKNELNKIQEIQILEQNLQNILYQKQSFQIELNESKTALEELEKSKDDVYKIIGQLMIKTDKDKIKKELEDKEKMLELRLNSLEKQEKNFMEKIEDLRKAADKK